MTTDDDTLRRLAEAREEIQALAGDLSHNRRGSKKAERQDIARHLNAAAASLRTVELRLAPPLPTRTYRVVDGVLDPDSMREEER